MPIRAELRHHYGKIWRTVTRPRILARAGNKCEQCFKPNHKRVTVISLPGVGQFWRRRTGDPWIRCIDAAAFPATILYRTFADGVRAARRIRVVLTVAHLNHTSGDDRDENLKALCQWCHLNYDLAHHHETRAARKDAARPLLTPQPPTKEANL